MKASAASLAKTLGVLGAVATAVWLLRPTTPADDTPGPLAAPEAREPAPAPSVAPPTGTPSGHPGAVASSAAPPTPDDIRAWAREHPARALDWLAHAVPGPERDAALEIVSAEVAQFDPAQAVAIVEQWTSGNLPLLENLVQQWALRDAAAAAAYAIERPPGEMRDRLLARVALARAETDPTAAARLVVDQIPPGSVHDEAVISILHRWAQSDAPGASAWVSTFPPGPLRKRALHELAAAAP